MKKYILILSVLMLGLTFASCEKDEVENTATVATAGEWTIHVSCVDANGEVLDPDWFGDGEYTIVTCNTASNVPGKMWLIDDICYYYPYMIEVNVDQGSLTFNADEAENIYGETDYGGASVTVTDGKIIKDGATDKIGHTTDYIEFYISFSPDALAEYLPAGCRLKITGFRTTGFHEYDPLNE